jgi:D-alanine-D-alanine ligase
MTGENVRAKQTIVVLLGGNSVEREISLKSGASVALALQNLGYKVVRVDPQDAAWQEQLDKAHPCYVFIALHGKDGEDGVMQGYLELQGVPYSGSGVLGSALAMHKDKSKLLWQQHGLATLPFIAFNDIDNLDHSWFDQVPLPYSLKVVNGGSSIGVKKIVSRSELAQSFSEIKDLGSLFMLEKWANGTEYAVGIMNGKALPVVEVIPSGGFYDYEAKYIRNDTQYLCPSNLSDAQEIDLQEIALKAFAAISCSHFGRVDFISDNDNYYLLEANTIPGFTEKSLLPLAASRLDIGFEDLVAQLLPDFS